MCNRMIAFIDWGMREFGTQNHEEWKQMNEWRRKYQELRDKP